MIVRIQYSHHSALTFWFRYLWSFGIFLLLLVVMSRVYGFPPSSGTTSCRIPWRGSQQVHDKGIPSDTLLFMLLQRPGNHVVRPKQTTFIGRVRQQQHQGGARRGAGLDDSSSWWTQQQQGKASTASTASTALELWNPIRSGSSTLSSVQPFLSPKLLSLIPLRGGGGSSSSSSSSSHCEDLAIAQGRPDGCSTATTTTTMTTTTRLYMGTSSSVPDDDDDEYGTNVTGATIMNRTKRARILISTGLGTIVMMAFLAKMGLLPGSPINIIGTTDHHLWKHIFSLADTYAPYSDDQILRDMGAAALTSVLAYIYVRFIQFLLHIGIITSPRDSRKIIHTLSAPLYMLFWPLFSTAVGARWFAATAPLLNGIRLYLAGSGQDDTLAASVSRSGNIQEAFQGPLIYVMVFLCTIILFWRDSPLGIVPMTILAGGDGMADLIGRRWGKSNPWPTLSGKSIAGTMAFWITSTIFSTGLLLWINAWCPGGAGLALSTTTTATSTMATSLAGVGSVMTVGELVLRAALISLVSAIVELIPGIDDNYSVPISAAIATLLLLPPQ